MIPGSPHPVPRQPLPQRARTPGREKRISHDDVPPIADPQRPSIRVRVSRAEPALRRMLPALYLLAAVAGTLVCGVARECNNFRIFRAAHVNLLAGVDLYALHPAQHLDLFKYSPTFALLFAPFEALPFALGLLAWNVLNAGLLYWAVRRLLPGARGTLALGLLWVALVATMDGTQSNALVAALMVLAFLALERRRVALAALCVGLGAMVKIFPVAAVVLFLLHPRPWRASATLAAVVALLVALPLLVLTPAELAAQYHAWWVVEGVDALDRGQSVMRLLHEWLGWDGANWPLQLVGAAAAMLPALSQRARDDVARRRLVLASVLLFVVLFNHKAEQPTWIIALTGVAIWCVSAERGARAAWRLALAAAILAATLPMMVAGLLPHWGARQPLLPFLLVSAGCAVVWGWMQAELLSPLPAHGRAAVPARAAHHARRPDAAEEGALA